MTQDRRLERYDIVSGKKVGSTTGLHRITANSLDCHADSQALATAGADGLVKVSRLCAPATLIPPNSRHVPAGNA